jgi:sec-independent protein translocase protein TatA
MPDIGPLELIVVAVIALLIFGPSKVADVGGALGKSIREFRTASKEDVGAPSILLTSAPADSAPAQVAAPLASNAATESVRFCTECGIQNRADQKFCSNCGAAMAVASV